MAIAALHHIRTLRGHTNPHLMLCEDGKPYIVKFRHNPQGCRALASEYLATKLAQYAHLPLAQCSIIAVPHFIVQRTPALSSVFLSDGTEEVGLHFGSCFVGTGPGDSVYDYLPDSRLGHEDNASIFGGMLAFDKWLSNTDTRQAVFVREKGSMRYHPHFIDQSQCFAGSKWELNFDPTHGLFHKGQVYRAIKDWEVFEPFIEAFMSVSATAVWTIAQDIPPEWYDGRRGDLDALVEALLRRRSSIFTLVEKQLKATPELFPQWSRRVSVYIPGGQSSGVGLSSAASFG